MTDQPDIFIGSIRIQEPIIAVTSLIVSIISFIGFYKTRFAKKNNSIRLYRLFILFVGISCAFSGFLGHAFLYSFGMSGKYSTWFTLMVAVSFAQQAALIRFKSYIRSSTFQFLSVLNIVQIVTFISIISVNPQLFLVETHTAIGLLLIVFVFEYLIYKKVRSRISLNILVGIVMLMFAVMFQIFKISATNWFTYFDFAHIFMSLCMLFFSISILRYHETE